MIPLMKTRLILASQSPRRRQLLLEAGIDFDVIPSQVDESAFDPTEGTPETYACRLARAKAGEVAQRFPQCWVLGADTIVDCQGEIIGKPKDRNDAERITRRIFSSPHRVITGLALIRLDQGVEKVESQYTTVFPRPLSEEQIAAHLEGGTWQGKAGAYAIQETGDALVERLEGSLSNVIGLPMEKVTQWLAEIE